MAAASADVAASPRGDAGYQGGLSDHAEGVWAPLVKPPEQPSGPRAFARPCKLDYSVVARAVRAHAQGPGKDR